MTRRVLWWSVNPMRALATGVAAALLRVFWIRSPHLACLLSAMACATNLACSRRASPTVGRWSSPINGCAVAMPGSCRAPSCCAMSSNTRCWRRTGMCSGCSSGSCWARRSGSGRWGRWSTACRISAPATGPSRSAQKRPPSTGR
mgnify:CR=1 FL=1